MLVHLSTFVDFVNIFIRYRSKQRTSELSVMATKMVSTTVFFPVKKLFLQNENLNKFRTCLLIFSILFKFSAGFFSYFSLTRLVNMGIICICSCMFHNFYLSVFCLSVLSVFLLVCISTGKPSR